ncbi:MAG: M20/M25/M40 family metallo-hydrolase, partial [Paracoccaceae bacterium]
MSADLATTTDILADLIGFPTVSADSNLAMIAYLAARLEDSGARVDTFRDETGRKANLFATFGPEADGGIVLSGHTDVVPVTDRDWSCDPFVMTQVEGRLYGRGACDMKGFIAATLAMAPKFAAAVRGRPLHLAFTYDEEVGCIGAPFMIAEMAETMPKAAACIVGEPSLMKVVTQH